MGRRCGPSFSFLVKRIPRGFRCFCLAEPGQKHFRCILLSFLVTEWPAAACFQVSLCKHVLARGAAPFFSQSWQKRAGRGAGSPQSTGYCSYCGSPSVLPPPTEEIVTLTWRDLLPAQSFARLEDLKGGNPLTLSCRGTASSV